jgi:hypothetical protein
MQLDMMPRHEMRIAPHLIPECLLLLPAVLIWVVGTLIKLRRYFTSFIGEEISLLLTPLPISNCNSSAI